MTSNDLLKNVDSVLKEEGSADINNLSASEKLEKFVIPGLYNSKSTIESLYKFQPKDKPGFVGKIKNLILNKLKNITLNVIERQSMRQQKFNELTYQAIQMLVEENKELKKLVSKESSK